jgi:acetyl-CoA synthetase
MEKIPVISVVPEASRGAHISPKLYEQLYRESIEDPQKFWAKLAGEFLSWEKPWHTVLEHDYLKAHIRWFEGGKLNVSTNCLDRHLKTRANQTALIWEGNEPGDVRTYTYQELTKEVCRFANMLKGVGINRGDRVAVYLPMIPELMFVMLACARIGAIHSVTFAGFSADALRGRIMDSGCKILVTANEGLRGPKTIRV